MKKDINKIGILLLLAIFFLFYIFATFFLNSRKINKNIINNEEKTITENISFDDEKNIVSNLFEKVKILYDVVNNQFKVNQDDQIIIGDIVYKKINNFDEIMNNLFTENGCKKYISDLGNYFAYTEEGYYLAGNLVSYQTYYFRGEETNIYITDATDKEINGIIYVKWTSNNKNTLATIKVVKVDNNWLIDDINILAIE